MGRKVLLLLIIAFPLFLTAQPAAGEEDAARDSIMKDMLREDYINASLLVATSGTAIYSAPGHAALRLECPKHGIDYCFEFDNIINLTHILDYINGDMQGVYHRTFTQAFLNRYTEEGRGVVSMPLNLTPEQETKLWQSLDYLTDSVGAMPFDFLSNNCCSIVVQALKESLDSETIEYASLNPHLAGTHRQVFPYIFKNAPWAEFCWNLLMGTDFDQELDLDTRLFPMALIDLFPDAVIRDAQGGSRPLGRAKPQTLVNARQPDAPFPITPKDIFIALLALALVASATEFFRGYTILSRVVDVVLMTIETLLGLIVSYMLIFSHQVATSWNWLIIVLSPVPLLLWILWRGKQKFHRVYLVFTIVLLVFILGIPLIPQMQYAAMPALLAAFAVRTMTRWLLDRRPKPLK